MLILALDAALARCSAAVLRDDAVLAAEHVDGARGHAATLPPLAESVLRKAGIEAAALDLVAVTVGPGSFTGVRAAVALAHGIALGAGVALVGVTLGEAFAAALPHLGGRVLWTALHSRRGRVFLELHGAVQSRALDDLPPADGRVAVAGDAAIAVAAALAARGADVMLTDLRLPLARFVALAALDRQGRGLPPHPALPLYVDAPEAYPPPGGLRPAPA